MDETLEFQKIYTHYQPKILRYLTRLAGESEAEDLTQDVFVKVGRNLASFRGDSQLSTWIYRIATNTAIDKLRSLGSPGRSEVNLQDDFDEIEGVEVWTGEEVPSLEQMLMRKEMYACFESYVRKLPVNYRTVVILSEIEELSNHEIAEVLGLSLEVVKIRLHRGRTQLLQELRTHCRAEDWL